MNNFKEIGEEIIQRFPEENLEKKDFNFETIVTEIRQGHNKLEACGILKIDIKGENIGNFRITMGLPPPLSQAMTYRKKGELQKALTELNNFEMNGSGYPAFIHGPVDPEEFGIISTVKESGGDRESANYEKPADPFKYALHFERFLVNEGLGDLNSAFIDLEAFWVEYQKIKLKLKIENMVQVEGVK